MASRRAAKPVGHIALSFKPEDAPRLTDAFMARLAEEYLELMGILGGRSTFLESLLPLLAD